MNVRIVDLYLIVTRLVNGPNMSIPFEMSQDQIDRDLAALGLDPTMRRHVYIRTTQEIICDLLEPARLIYRANLVGEVIRVQEGVTGGVPFETLPGCGSPAKFSSNQVLLYSDLVEFALHVPSPGGCSIYEPLNLIRLATTPTYPIVATVKILDIPALEVTDIIKGQESTPIIHGEMG